MSQLNNLIGSNGYTPAVASLHNIPNGAGSGTSPVSVAIASFTDQFGGGVLPPDGSYSVVVTSSQACAVSISNKSSSGFTVTLTPLASGSIAAGSFDCLVFK